MVKLNGVNIWNYRMLLQGFTGDLDLAPRKKITEKDGTAPNDIFMDDSSITFRFIASYDSVLDMGLYLPAFRENIQNHPSGSIQIIKQYGAEPSINDMDNTYYGRFVSGYKVQTTGLLAKISLTMKFQGVIIK